MIFSVCLAPAVKCVIAIVAFRIHLNFIASLGAMNSFVDSEMNVTVALSAKKIAVMTGENEFDDN